MRRTLQVAAGAVALIGVAFLVGRVSASSGPTPGSPSDPLVTKSYVSAAIQEALSGQTKAGPPPGTNFVLVKLDKGFKLILQGNAEMIVRRGTTSAVSGAAGGIVDLTAGANVTAGSTVSDNHLLLVPKSNGSGILASNWTVVLVSGSYSVSD